MSTTMWIIVASAIATYLTRIGGHLVLSRFERVHPRVEAALDAVPAAVLTTLVAPALLNAGPTELLALAVTAAVAWYRGLMASFLAGALVILMVRNLM